MILRGRIIAVVMFAFCGIAAVMAADEVGERDWPAQAGTASICLWADDALAACSITIDDNTAPDHAWRQMMSQKYDLRVTWFIVTSTVGRGWGGTWDGWCKLHAEGHDVQSHTVNHLNTNSPTWHGPEVEYADLIKAIGAALPDTVPATDILGRLRSKTKPSIGPIEPSPGDKRFMAMWQTYFRQMQAAVQPPSPK